METEAEIKTGTGNGNGNGQKTWQLINERIFATPTPATPAQLVKNDAATFFARRASALSPRIFLIAMTNFCINYV